VKLSGPQKNVRMPVSSEIGTRLIAFSTYGPSGPSRAELAEREVVGDAALDLPRRAHRLEQADHQAADLLAVVAVEAGSSSTGQSGRALASLGDQVVVLGGLQRDVTPDALAELAGPHAGAVDDVLALDVPWSVDARDRARG
jgi:hypothetical protein